MAKGSSTSTAKTKTSSKTSTKPTGAGKRLYTSVANQSQQTAQLPYTPVTQGVAPLTDEQKLAIQNINSAYDQTSPYYQRAAQLYDQAAKALTGEDINQYYNPMADKVMANLQEIFGQQNRATLGQLAGAAGGVGADRIAVGQSELAREQGLAGGQTMANLWQNALQAAQAQQQTELAAGQGFANLAPSQMQALLEQARFQLGAGTQEQQTEQSALNAIYNQQMQEQAFPYEQLSATAPYTLASAAGMGTKGKGQTSGTQTATYTPPPPNPYTQIAGGLSAGAGAFGSLSGKGSAAPLAAAAVVKRGGAIKRAPGGEVEALQGSMFDAPFIPKPKIPIPDTRMAPMQAPNVEFLSAKPPEGSQDSSFSGSAGMGSNIGSALGSLGGLGNSALHTKDPTGGGWGATIKPESGAGWLNVLRNSLPFDAGGAVNPPVAPPISHTASFNGPQMGQGMNQFIQAMQNWQSQRPQPGGDFRSWINQLPALSPGYNPVTSRPIPGVSPWQNNSATNMNMKPFGHMAGGGGIKGYAFGGGPYTAPETDALDPIGSYFNWIASHAPKPVDPTSENLASKFSFSPAAAATPTGTSFVQAPKLEAMNQGVEAPQFNSPFQDTKPHGIEGSTGPIVSPWTGPTMSPAQEAVADANKMVQDQNTPPEAQKLGPTEPGVASAEDGTTPPPGTPSGGPQSPYSQFQGGPWDAVRATLGQPQQMGYFDRLSRNPLFLMGMGMLGSDSPYFAQGVGQGAMKGLSALNEVRKSDANIAAQNLQNALEAGRLDVANRAQNLSEKDKPFDNMMSAYRFLYSSGMPEDKIFGVLQQRFPDQFQGLTGMSGSGVEEEQRSFPGEYQEFPVTGTPFKVSLPKTADPERAVDWRDNVPDQPTIEHFANPSGSLVPKPQIDRMKMDTTQILKDSETKYEGALESKNQLHQMIGHIREQDPTGMLAPGSLQSERGDVQKFVQTVKSIAGVDLGPGFLKDLERAGNIEAIRKLQTQLGFSLARTLGTREAMQVIQQAMGAVPGLGMTLAGQLNVFYGIMSGIDRNTDRHLFLQQWANNRYGSTVGAQDYFDNGVGRDLNYVNRAQALRDLEWKRMTSGAGPDNPAYQKAKEYIRDKLLLNPADYGYE